MQSEKSEFIIVVHLQLQCPNGKSLGQMLTSDCELVNLDDLGP